MSDIQQRMQQIKGRFMVNGVLGKDKTQQTLSEEFQAMLLLRTPDQTIQGIISEFVVKNEPQIDWLGNAIWTSILCEAQESTGVDLNAWIGKE